MLYTDETHMDNVCINVTQVAVPFNLEVAPELSLASDAGSDAQHRHNTYEQPQPEIQPRSMDKAQSQMQGPDGMPKILLAEDNWINQKVVVAILKRFGYAADIVVNGVEAVEAFAAKHYDIILMDINMPEMDGVEAMQKIRDVFPAEEQPYIIAVTANAMIGDKEKYLASGMDGYVSKPIRPELLLDAIKHAAAVLSIGESNEAEYASSDPENY